MDQETQRLLEIASVVALFAHIVIRHYKWACLETVLVAPLIYFVESFIRLHLPPAKLFWVPMEYFFLVFYCVPSAVVIGLPFLAWRRSARRRERPQ